MFRATAVSDFHNVVGDLANLGVPGWLRFATFDQRISPVMETYSRQAAVLSCLPPTGGPNFRHTPSYFSRKPGNIRSQFLVTAGQVKV